MGLISTEVEVGFGGINARYYSNLGYVIPKHWNETKKGYFIKKGTKITVKIEDVPLKSGVLVDVECDCCKKKYQMQYMLYNLSLHDNKLYCAKCAHTVLNSGENHYRWRHDKTQEEREQQRSYPEYIEFVKRVLARDDYTCQVCGKKINGDAEVHHLDGYDWCKEKRIDDTNGITLCGKCHKNFHSVYGYGDNTKEQFEEWIGYALDELEKYNGELPTSQRIYCFEKDTFYKNAIECGKHFGISKYVVHNCCNHQSTTEGGYHLLYEKDYIKLTRDDIFNYILNNNNRKRRKVICLTTNEVFDSPQDADKKFNINGVGRCCRIHGHYSGTLSDGTLLQWMYYDEYLLYKRYGLNPLEELTKLRSNHIPQYKIICLTTGEIFNSIAEAHKKYSIDRHDISDNCNPLKKKQYAGKLPDGTPIQWMFYEDFLKLPIEEQEKILARNKGSSDNDGSFVA